MIPARVVGAGPNSRATSFQRRFSPSALSSGETPQRPLAEPIRGIEEAIRPTEARINRIGRPTRGGPPELTFELLEPGCELGRAARG